MGFVLGLNASTIQQANVLEQIAITRKAGYDAIELWSDHLTAHTEAGGSLKDVKKALDDNGLTVPTLVHIGSDWLTTEGDEYVAAIDEVKRRMDQAVTVGGQRVIAGPSPNPIDLSFAAERYRELLQIGREIGVLPAMEFLGFVNGIHTIQAAWQIVVDAQDDDGTIVLDPFHIFRGGSPIEDLEQIPGDRIAVYHFNDATDEIPRTSQGDGDRVLPGDGVLPLVDQLRIIQKNGYSGVISLELFREDLWAQDPLKVAQLGYEKMKAVIDQV